LSSDLFTELEQKIDILLTTLEQLREDKKKCLVESDEKKGIIVQHEGTIKILQNELESLKLRNIAHENKLKAVTERIQGVLAKCEAV
jgi:chromosome segregation ATPase